MDKKELIQDIDSLFQFTITISIFLLTFINILFRYTNSTADQSSFAEFKWVNMTVALVAAYVLYRILRRRFHNWVYKVLNIGLLAEIIAVVIAVSVVLVNGNQIHSHVAYYLLIGSLWATMSLSTVIFIFLVVAAIFLKKTNAWPMKLRKL